MHRILALLIPLILPLAATGPAQQTGDPPDELVFSVLTWEGEYFSKDIPGGVQTTPRKGSIGTIAADGTGRKQVIAPGDGVDYPAYSPDGRWIYYQARIGGAMQVLRCKPDGSEVTKIAPAAVLGKPWKDAYGYALSQGSSKMVYTVHDGNSGRVVLAGADGSEPRLVAPQLGYMYMAALSPAGDRVVFSGPASGYRLKLVEGPAGQPVDLTPNHPESFVPRFTPDGRTVVFFRRDGDVYTVGADGKDLRRLTEGNRNVEFRLSDNDRHGSSDGPDISPDGKRVAYIAVKDGVPNVCTMNLDGSGQRQITTRKSRCGRVRWSPDGKRLAFVSFEGAWPQLFVIGADGGEPRRLTDGNAAVYFVAWKPRSR